MSGPRWRRARRLAVSALLTSALGLGAAAPAVAEDEPLFVGWTAALPALAGQYEPTSADDCVAGRVTCVQRTIREMERRLDPLAASCSHSAVFALAYLRTTETYLETATTPGFYADPAFVNHEDVVFAELYFDAIDHWDAGRTDLVPPAWRIAFEAADRREVNGSGDLLLGINAHVNRDLPFALAAIGLVAPDGSSRKPDHDRVDAMLNQVVQPLMAEQARRFDPSMSRFQTPYGVGYTGLMQLLVTWRESAWRHAEMLVNAPDDATRAQVAAAIEADAALNARAIVAGSRYLFPVSSTAARDAHCAAAADQEG